jgi:hypothetical protein
MEANSMMLGGSAYCTYSEACEAASEIVSQFEDCASTARADPEGNDYGAFRIDSMRMPDTVNLDELPGDLRKHRDILAYLVYRTTASPVFNSRDWHERNGWTPIRREDLVFLFGRGSYATRAVKWLIDERIWECDGKWVVGEKAMWYRLMDQHAKGSTVRAPIVKSRSAARIMRLEGKSIDRTDWLPVHFALQRWLRELEIDYAQALDWVDRQTGRREFFARLAVEAISDRNFRLKVCQFGRVHSNVSNLASTLRRCLRWRGEPLVEIDVRNTQPLLIAHLALRAATGELTIEDQRLMGRSHDAKRGEGRGSEASSGKHNPYVGTFFGQPKLLCVKDTHGVPDDLIDLISLCERGQFYEEMAAEVWKDDGLNRDSIKGISVWLLFDHTMPTLPYWRELEGKFPTFAKHIAALKALDYRTTACAAQRFESLIMIRGACAELMYDHPQVPIWTVHDSIMTTREHLDTARAVILAEFGRYGITPTLQIK